MCTILIVFMWYYHLYSKKINNRKNLWIYLKHIVLYIWHQGFLWMPSCCSMEYDCGRCQVNSGRLIILNVQMKCNLLALISLPLDLFATFLGWLQSCSRISSLWRRLMVVVVVVFLPCALRRPCFRRVHRLVVGSVWGIFPCACPGVPHRSLAAQVVLMSFLTASTRGRPSARRSPIQAAWVRFWQIQSSFLRVPETTTVAVSQRPLSLAFRLRLMMGAWKFTVLLSIIGFWNGIFNMWYVNHEAVICTKLKCMLLWLGWLCVAGWPGTSHSVDICEGLEDWTTDLSNISDSDEEDDVLLVSLQVFNFLRFSYFGENEFSLIQLCYIHPRS